jgi:phosphoglycolate phosphatase
MRASRAPIVVFDLDGTLADTAGDLIATLNVILDQEGAPPFPPDQAGDLIGAGGRPLITRGLKAAGREVEPDRLEALYHRFLAHYEANICVETRLFPGASAALDRLEAAGYILAVCTNKFEAHAVKVLEALGIAGRFAAICGRDTFPVFKPDPAHILLTVHRAGGDPRAAVMVGDSRSDTVAAHAAKVPVVAVSFGYTDVPVRDLNPDRVIDHFDELFDAVEALLAGEPAAMRA